MNCWFQFEHRNGACQGQSARRRLDAPEAGALPGSGTLGTASDLSEQKPLKEVPVAMRFLFRAMAQQRHGRPFAQRLQKPEREFLAVIFDGCVASIHRVAFAQFFQVTTTELTPADRPRLEFSQQPFARAEVRHPDMISRRGHAPASKPGDQDAQPVFVRFNGGED